MTTIYTWLVLASILSGCTTYQVNVIAVNERLASRELSCQVDILYQRPDQKFKEIAALELQGKPGISEYVDQLKQRACELGGDAVIIGQSQNKTSVFTAGNYIGSTTKMHGQASVIRWVK